MTHGAWSPEIPTIVGPLVGIKAYRVRDYRIYSHLVDQTVERVQRASCVMGLRRHDPCEAPRWDCRCGLYVYRRMPDYGDWFDLNKGFHIVWSVVVLWGRIIEHRTGWRAQYVRVERLICAPPVENIVGTVAEAWGVPLTVISGLHSEESYNAQRVLFHGLMDDVHARMGLGRKAECGASI